MTTASGGGGNTFANKFLNDMTEVFHYDINNLVFYFFQDTKSSKFSNCKS